MTEVSAGSVNWRTRLYPVGLYIQYCTCFVSKCTQALLLGIHKLSCSAVMNVQTA